jgi:tetratricopeptide (TPR) repeat protein
LTDRSKFFLCTGFHRSGTSLIAQSMLESGLSMGDQLMGASFGNPLGHVEDQPIVDLHDRVLTANGTNWRYCGDGELVKPEWLTTNIEQYLQQRSEVGGVKDPRAALFLPEWLQAGGDSIRFIFVYRHWANVVQSIFNRHGQEFLYFNQSIQSRSSDLAFWQNPNTLIKMWRHTSDNIIEFVRQHPSKCLLISQEDFVAQNGKAQACAGKIGLPELALKSRSFRPDLMQQQIYCDELELIDHDSIVAANETYRTMQSLADLPAENYPVLTNPEHTAKVKKSEHSGLPLSQVIPLPQARSLSTEIKDATLDLSALSWSQALEFLDKAPLIKLKQAVFEQLLYRPFGKYGHYERLYMLARRANLPMVAELCLFRAKECSLVPRCNMFLGDIYRSKGLQSEAQTYFEKASELKPDSGMFIARLADMDISNKDLAAAKSKMIKATELEPGHPYVKVVIDKLAKAESQGEKQKSQHNLLDCRMPLLESYQQVVDVMTEDHETGKLLDRYMQQSVFLLRDNKEWLQSGLAHLDSKMAKVFELRIQRQWQKLWPQQVLETELNAEVPLITPYRFSSYVKETELKLAIQLHAYYLELLPQLFCFIDNIPFQFDLVITCKADDKDQVGEICASFNRGCCTIIAVDNRGRDIAPWLMHKELYLKYDLVCKLHSKSSPHEPELCGWRRQLLFSLLASPEYIESLVKAFEDDPKLGVAMPPYHPRILNDIGWGLNQSLAAELCTALGLSMPKAMDVFPAGSMFWYRPAALKGLLNKDWKIDDFPEEAGQSDGTIMHALERLIPTVANYNGFQSRFVHLLDAWHKTGYQQNNKQDVD